MKTAVLGAALSLFAACIAPAALEDRSCPCAEWAGYQCCQGRCIREGQACADQGDASATDWGSIDGTPPPDVAWADETGSNSEADAPSDSAPRDSPSSDSPLSDSDGPPTTPDAVAPVWQTIVGYAGGVVNTFNLQIASDGALFLAVSKVGPLTSQIVTVESYDGQSWRQLGADRPISAAGTTFALMPDKTPYLFNDGRIERFRDGQWSSLPPMPSGLSVPYFLATFAVDKNGWLHVTTQDAKKPPALGVARWNGSNWQLVGVNADLGPAFGMASFLSFDSSHTYLSVSDDGKVSASVWRFTGTAWERLVKGDAWLPAGPLVVARSGDAYLASTRDGHLHIVKWTNGPGWQMLGEVPNAVDNSVEPSIALDADDNLYAAYVGDREPGPDVVMGPILSRWDGANWIDLPMTGLAPTVLIQLQLSIDRRAGKTILYLAMQRNDDLVLKKFELPDR